jgi:hypothetical protein
MKTFSKTLRRARSFRASREKSVDKVQVIFILEVAFRNFWSGKKM